MRFVIEQDAGLDSRFGANSFASQIGKQIPVEVAPNQYEQGTIRSAEVVEDGKKARIEVELPDTAQVKAALDTGITRANVSFRPPWVL